LSFRQIVGVANSDRVARWFIVH